MPMKVIVADSAGFCRGVERAIERARSLAAQGEKVHTDGPIVHNRQVIESLRAEGIEATDEPAAVRDGTLLIRAHGITPERRHYLQSLNLPLADATCPDVARIQGLVRRHVRQGCAVLVYGDKNHPEVEGLLGFAEGYGHVVTKPADVDELPPLDRVCLVSQSTQFPGNYAEVAARVRERFGEVLVLDTICASTRRRQNELAALLELVDVVVVVGSAHSANTRHLAAFASRARPTFRVDTADELPVAELRAYGTAGLVGGASTPRSAIDAVRVALERV